MRTTYNKFPEVSIQGYDNHAWQGWSSIHSVINTKVSGAAKTVLIVDCYPGVRLDELEQQLVTALDAALVLNIESARRDEQALHDLLARNLTDDRVFGVLSCHHLDEFLIATNSASSANRLMPLVKGWSWYTALALHWHTRVTCWFMLTFRAGKFSSACAMTGWVTGGKNQDEDILRRYKRAFSLNGGSSTNTKRRYSNVPIICSIPR